MTSSFRLLAALAAVLWIASPATADDCRHEDLLKKTVDAKGATRIRVDAAAGYLRIVGRPGLDEVRVKGTACASKKKLLESIHLSVERSGSEVRVEAEIDRGGFSFFGNGNARLDLEIEVPDSVPLDVNDSSGSIEITSVAALDVDDSSGEINIEGVAGKLRLEDSSGSIEVSDVEGDIRLEDSSGSIDIERVSGSVDIVEDGSGSIDISKVKGSVLVRRDGSGSISVRNIDGDFTVERDGSGSINHRDVGGKVDIPRKKR
jgi:DUF4097 and DUF4098 domain-containing protein YvlB